MRPPQPQHRSPWDCLAPWLLLLLPGAVQGSFQVSVWPEAPVVEHGGSVWINCSSTCREVSCTSGLDTSLTKAQSERGVGWAAFNLTNITEWASAPKCYFINGTETQVVAANISVYRVPEQVVLEPLPELELGQAYNLTCRVLSVAPVRHLTVTLRRGGQALHTEIFQTHSTSEPESITVTHELIPRRGDHGQNVTCHAALDLGPHGPLFRRSSPPQELSVYGAVQGSCQVSVWPEAPVVEHGGSVWINCSSTCREVNCTVGLETSLTKGQPVTGVGWAAFNLTNITEWASSPKCHFTCRGEQHSRAVRVAVYRAPEQVVLEPLPELELGQAYNLTCRVLSVAPVRHLTVTLRRGGQALHAETFQTHSTSEPESITVTHELIPRRGDHGQNVTCHAALDLGPHGPLFQRSSPPQELRAFVSPTTTVIASTAVGMLVAMLLGILAWGLVQRHRAQRDTRPEPGEEPRRCLDFEMAQASAEHSPAAGDSLDWPEDAAQ